jgi:hypothetical protein
MAIKPELNVAKAYEKIKANKYNENFDILLNYIEEVSEELELKVNTINSQLSSSVLSNLQAVYPVGSLFISTTDTCPIANLFGTWEKVSEGRVLQGATSSQVPGKTIDAGLPNIKGSMTCKKAGVSNLHVSQSGALYVTSDKSREGAGANSDGAPCAIWNIDASRSNAIYGKSNTVQPPAYLVNIWKRTA